MSLSETVRESAEARYLAYAERLKSPAWERINEIVKEKARREGRHVPEEGEGPVVMIINHILRSKRVPAELIPIIEMHLPYVEVIDGALKAMTDKLPVKMRMLFLLAETAKAALQVIEKKKGVKEIVVLQAQVEVERLEAEILCVSNAPEYMLIVETVGQMLLPLFEVDLDAGASRPMGHILEQLLAEMKIRVNQRFPRVLNPEPDASTGLKRFSYEAKNAQGGEDKSFIDAENQASAEAMIRKKGFYVTKISEV